MKMLYHIHNLCPRTDIDFGRCGFTIALFPGFKEAVGQSKLDQRKIDGLIERCHRPWLDGCGFNQMFDPDKDHLADWEERKLGKTPKLGPISTPLYDKFSIRISWGEWGPEHITVPGNACGLDIDRDYSAPKDGRILVPHNIDSLNQIVLILTVFTTIADYLIDIINE